MNEPPEESWPPIPQLRERPIVEYRPRPQPLA